MLYRVNRFFRATSLCAVALSALFCSAVFAHQQKIAISTVLFNSRTQNIEVMHRFNVHDAEHAAREIFGKNADIVNSEKTQQQFSGYVNQRFEMHNENGRLLPLKPVGHELVGKFFWVYQETKQPVTLKNITIRHDALRDIWPNQVNTINIEGRGDLQTLTFSDSVELLKVEFNKQ